MYYYFNEEQSYIQIHRSKAFLWELRILKSLNDCSNFRPKSIGKRFYEPTMKQRTRTDIILIPDEQNYHEAKSTQNPTTPKLNAPMLQLILYTIKEMWHSSKHEVTSKFSLLLSGEANTDTLWETKCTSSSRWMNNWCENKYTQVPTHKEAKNIHLNFINGYQKNI